MIDLNYAEIKKLINEANDEIQSNKNYRMLWQGEFQRLWESRKNNRILFCIYIKNNILNDIEFDCLANNRAEIEKEIQKSNIIELNNVGEIINFENKTLSTLEMKKFLQKLSCEHLVFFFGEDGISRYIHGEPVDDCNIFYSMEDRINYYKKYDISKLDDVISDYASKIVTQQVAYMCFFADNATLNQISSQYINRNILKNKPEHYMRDHLCDYLSHKMKYTFSTERQLVQSKRALDIYFEAEGYLYFIEVKWLGVSINENGTSLTKPYGEKRAEDGVIQSLEYVIELINTNEANFRAGCLVIFDARDKKTDINFKEYSFLPESLKDYLSYFRLLPIIPLNKKHPA